MKFTNIVFLLAITFFGNINCYSQTIIGGLNSLANKNIKLIGFNGFNQFVIDSSNADALGNFSLTYNNSDYGIGKLFVDNQNTYLVILSNENLSISGISFSNIESIKVASGYENQLFSQYALEHPRREQCLSAWNYLSKIYKLDTLFSIHQAPIHSIATEKKRIKNEDSLFLASLPKTSYVNYYLPLRKLVSSVSTIAQYRTEEIPATFAAFRNLDYTDPRLFKSGLLKDAIESHFWLIENSGRSLDSVYVEMQISIDRMLENLMTDEQKLYEITEHLFTFLEQRSLFTASEYLAIKLLNEQSCTLNNDFASQLESYRAMKKGNTAPDIVFNGDMFARSVTSGNVPQKLSDIQSKYKAIVFGASWCPQCPKELQEINRHYTNWKQQGVEVVFLSLDEDKQTFENFTKPFSFVSICDYKKWDSSAIKDYHVFATPTIYLLNDKNEIILRPNSAGHLNSWVDWFLVQGNK